MNEPSAAPPQYSADGRWWWTGTEWVPAPPPPPQGAPPQTQPPRQKSPFGAILAALIVFAIMVGLIWMYVDDQQRRDEFSDEFDRLACSEYGYCD